MSAININEPITIRQDKRIFMLEISTVLTAEFENTALADGKIHSSNLV